MRHRDDIDGLRAVAVLPILLFHFDAPYFSGGYVGVDVFFVISGYLITKNLLDGSAGREFGLFEFYHRRIRRIFPALVATIAATTVVASVVLMPHDFAAFGRSVIAAMLFFSNMHFWKESGYFDTAATLKPLLHTWSLSVEEQFYIFFPLFVMLCRRFAGARMFTVMLAAASASFALSALLVHFRPAMAFYIAPTRAWELLLGASIATGRLSAPNGRTAELAGVAGFLSIAAAVFLFTDQTPFPGIAALAPCLGTALLIHVGGSSRIASSILQFRPFVLIGLISYSLYLWHWPILALSRYYRVVPLRWEEAGELLAATFVVALLSWRYIETPFRRGSALTSREGLLVSAVGAATAILAVGFVLTVSRGLPQRFPQRVTYLDSFSLDRDFEFMSCHNRSPQKVAAGDLCAVGDRDVRPTLLLWGDSHGLALRRDIEAALRANRLSAIVATHDGCVPLFGLRRLNYSHPCQEFADAVRDLVERNRFQAVVLVANWTAYYNQPMTDGESTSPTRAESELALGRAIDRNLVFLSERGVKVILTDPVPGSRYPVPKLMAQREVYLTNVVNEFSRTEFLERNAKLFDVLTRNEGRVSARVQLWKQLCASGTCLVAQHGRPLYLDTNHPAKTQFDFAIPAFTEALWKLNES